MSTKTFAVRRLLLALSLSSLMQAYAAPVTPGVFKGTWAGPAVRTLPGPGPALGQTLEQYFADLKTGPRTPSRKHVLVLGGSRGFVHDSIPAAMAGVWKWGEDSGLWDADLHTDFVLINGGGGQAMHAGFQPKGLRDFDAVVVASAEGEWELSAAQRAAFLDFVRSGKGLVVMHAGLSANHGWRDYIDMIGAEQVGHPFNTLEHPVVPFSLINENRNFPATAFLPATFVKQDELYTLRNWSRNDVEVLLSMDRSRMDMKAAGDEVPPDGDIPVTWIKHYGKGRVFASSLGHTKEAFSDPEIVRMYSEAIKWVLQLSGGEPQLNRAAGESR
ncbi:hypothetical protein SAMN05216319_3393 [Duganella sp. CF402]|uniref:ThuA domain-containing protein n=1 Tax=unclassified Duganella TaxID=2636909 RepID=UPI0008B3954D|nr:MULTISPECIES: ThuA domain-containing protein [unclassified Duganella]RZT08197.1 hypothetical protein EV582_0225 [Duganella sp. BK701]SEM02484.1 hypothetical protein SAMN05216319_3393 [Duganella sp. CF402]